MIALVSEFYPIIPNFGLLIWSTIFFGLFWFIMSRFAFGPIKDALKTRTADIQNSLDEAKRAREEMANLKNENEKILTEARTERASILKEAKEAKDQIINEAKTKAKEEAQKIVSNAKTEIENQKMAALVDVKNQAGMMALDIAEKIIRKQLKGDAEQESYVNGLVDEIKLN
ncbi:MAG: F0F1 ATP synthase subunit B [Bacteroidota bacterium]